MDSDKLVEAIADGDAEMFSRTFSQVKKAWTTQQINELLSNVLTSLQYCDEQRHDGTRTYQFNADKADNVFQILETLCRTKKVDLNNKILGETSTLNDKTNEVFDELLSHHARQEGCNLMACFYRRKYAEIGNANDDDRDAILRLQQRIQTTYHKHGSN